MSVELTGPGNCAECGTGITAIMALEGDAGPFTFTIEDVRLEVPGLYVCFTCAGAIMAGEKQSAVTYEAAVMFLIDSFVPAIARYMARHRDDEIAYTRLHQALDCAEILAMASLLEAMERAAELEGCDREDMAVMVLEVSTPRDMAHLN